MRVLVTGGAGFIGSNLVEKLLALETVTLVRVLDNESTGFKHNIEPFASSPKFEYIKGDIRDFNTCLNACKSIDAISHQAALGSVTRSINDPVTTNEVNITGTLHIFEAARLTGIKRVVYAASSSTYGDHKALPKREDAIGNPLSPYAVTKYANELYAGVYNSLYGMEMVGLRYFNVFGPRQDPNGAYAAVIPLFIKNFLQNLQPVINGDGSHSRDFTYVENAVQANVLALSKQETSPENVVYNIACGEQTSLLELVAYLNKISNKNITAIHGPGRNGDVLHSLADIAKAKQFLRYNPQVTFERGLEITYKWYMEHGE